MDISNSDMVLFRSREYAAQFDHSEIIPRRLIEVEPPTQIATEALGAIGFRETG
jgi:hypothetical protein